MAGSRRNDWIIVAAIAALLVTGVLTIFDEEIARWRGKRQVEPEPPAGVVAPPAGNANTL